MKTGCITIIILTYLSITSLHVHSYTHQTGQTDSILNLIKKIEHNNLAKMSDLANQLLQITENKQAKLYGTYYLTKSKYYNYSTKEAVAQLDSLYKTISQKKYNYLKYEIDLIIGDYYFRQDNFDAGYLRLKKILHYGNTDDFRVAAYLLPNYSYFNSERRIKYIEKNIKRSYGKFTNSAYIKEWLKLTLLKTQFKQKKDINFRVALLQNAERCKKNGWIDLAVENLHSLIYVYGHSEQEQLLALESCMKGIELARQMGSTYLLTKLYHTLGHIHNNLSNIKYKAYSKLDDESEITILKAKQIQQLKASFQSYNIGLRYAQIQQNSSRTSRLYSALGGVITTLNKVEKNRALEDICAMYNCALDEINNSNFEAVKVLRARINYSALYFGLEACLYDVSLQVNYLSQNEKHLRKTEISIAKTDFERSLILHENTLNIRHTIIKTFRNTLILFIPLLLLCLVYYYRQKYLMLKKIEKQTLLIQAQNKSLKQAVRRLERANRGLENFAFTAAHDIKSPLRSIASFTGLLKRKYYNPESEDNVLFFDYIIKGCEDLNYFVDNLLKFSTILHKKTPIEKIALSEVLKKIRHRLKVTLEQEKVSFKIKKPLPLLQAHTSLVYQLFHNLITNSIKFKKQETRTVIEVGCFPKEKQTVFYVKDNGIGITPEKQKEVFDLFKKLHANTVYNGFGIGLAMCKKIVHYYKGKLWLKSTVGKETIVYFTLPNAVDPTNLNFDETKNIL